MSNTYPVNLPPIDTDAIKAEIDRIDVEIRRLQSALQNIKKEMRSDEHFGSDRDLLRDIEIDIHNIKMRRAQYQSILNIADN